jgi:hypothetical protein
LWQGRKARKPRKNVYTGLERGRRLEAAMKKHGKINMKNFKAPKDLQRRVRMLLKKQPTLGWDAALAEIIRLAKRRS